MLSNRLAYRRARRTAQSGSALLVALITVLVATLFTSSILQLSSSVSKRQTQELDNLRAFYLAEAGLAEAFEAMRVGKRGQIGSFDQPARFGNGFLWVDATPTPDNQMRLECTALLGTGRSTLSLIIEPIETELGIFSDEALIVQSVLLVDSFAPKPKDKEDTEDKNTFTLDPRYPFLYFDPVNQLAFYEGSFYHYTMRDGDSFHYDHAVSVQSLSENIAYGGDSAWDINVDDFTDHVPYPPSDSDAAAFLSDADLAHIEQMLAMEGDDVLLKLNELYITSPDYGEIEYDGVLDYFSNIGSTDTVVFGTGWGDTGGTVSDWPTTDATLSDGTPLTDGGVDSGTNPTTELSATDAALFGSNEGITIGGTGEAVEIYGDVVPGEGASVEIGAGGFVSGDTDPRSTPVELPEVEVPNIALASGVDHDSALPLILSPGTSGFEAVHIAADAELIIRGPATVVVGELTLAPGAALTLDTADGNVELFITGALELASGSAVTTSEQPDELSVQVSADDTLAAEPGVQLLATSQFYGTVYAPQAQVTVGAEFELWGSLVARVLDLEPGAKLHYANVGDVMPRVVSWRIVEVPAAIRTDATGVLRTLTTPMDELLPLSAAHDLGGIELTLTYTDVTGAEATYSGPEEDFDWGNVIAVADRERVGWDDWENAWDANWWDDWGATWWEAWGDAWATSWGTNWGTDSTTDQQGDQL